MQIQVIFTAKMKEARHDITELFTVLIIHRFLLFYIEECAITVIKYSEKSSQSMQEFRIQILILIIYQPVMQGLTLSLQLDCIDVNREDKKFRKVIF